MSANIQIVRAMLLVFYVLSTIITTFVSANLYRKMGGQNWLINIALTICMLADIVLIWRKTYYIVYSLLFSYFYYYQCHHHEGCFTFSDTI